MSGSAARCSGWRASRSLPRPRSGSSAACCSGWPGRQPRRSCSAIILMSTSAGLLLPLLKDAGEAGTEFGQLIMTAAALAEIVPILLLSLFFSAAAKTTADQLVSLAIFLALLVLIGLALTRVRRLSRLDRLLDRLEERSGQLRVRAALTLALACGVLAYRFGFASILGAFAAGLLVHLLEVSGREPNHLFLAKLEGIGFGFLIPIFFISVGVGFNVKDLVNHPATLAEVPLFLVALAGGARVARAVVQARHGRPPRGGRRPDAGDDADVRHRGGGDRPGNREAHVDHGCRAGRRWTAVCSPVPGQRGSDTRSWPETRPLFTRWPRRPRIVEAPTNRRIRRSLTASADDAWNIRKSKSSLQFVKDRAARHVGQPQPFVHDRERVASGLVATVKGHHPGSGRARIAARGSAEAVQRPLRRRSPGTPDDQAVPSGIR